RYQNVRSGPAVENEAPADAGNLTARRRQERTYRMGDGSERVTAPAAGDPGRPDRHRPASARPRITGGGDEDVHPTGPLGVRSPGRWGGASRRPARSAGPHGRG